MISAIGVPFETDAGHSPFSGGASAGASIFLGLDEDFGIFEEKMSLKFPDAGDLLPYNILY